jgi:hypothetical protein
MSPSLFSLHDPMGPFQILFSVYAYALPILLYASWAGLSLMDLSTSPQSTGRGGWAAAVLLIPLLGGAIYLLARASGLSRVARFAVVVGGLSVWLVPFAYGLMLVWGPLGPKAL